MQPNGHKIILSLCDFSGSWSKPYRDAGYDVRQIDLKHGQDVRLLNYVDGNVYGILAAPVCTAFTVSGAQYWQAKDASGATFDGLALVDACLRGAALYQRTLRFWVLENPVGRLKTWLGPPKFIFNPCDFGDPYTKKTCLWGEFVPPLPLFTTQRPVEPEFVIAANGDRYSKTHWYSGGKSEKTKEKRSITPPGFAKAFFEANQ